MHFCVALDLEPAVTFLGKAISQASWATESAVVRIFHANFRPRARPCSVPSSQQPKSQTRCCTAKEEYGRLFVFELLLSGIWK